MNQSRLNWAEIDHSRPNQTETGEINLSGPNQTKINQSIPNWAEMDQIEVRVMKKKENVEGVFFKLKQINV